MSLLARMLRIELVMLRSKFLLTTLSGDCHTICSQLTHGEGAVGIYSAIISGLMTI